MLDRLFSPFEGSCSPIPLALFRCLFYTGMALHMLPSLYHFADNFDASALRVQVWDALLYERLQDINPIYVRGAAWLCTASIACGLVGLLPRASAAMTGVLSYVFASFNGLNLHTLFLPVAWSVTWLLFLFGGGDEALSVRSLARGSAAVTRGSRTTRSLIVVSLVVTIFFAGIEKLHAGWPREAHLHNLLRYPSGSLLREWAVRCTWLQGPLLGLLASWATVAFELVFPFALAFRHTKHYAVAAYGVFFTTICSIIAVPPLACCIYAGAGLLMLDDRFFERRGATGTSE